MDAKEKAKQFIKKFGGSRVYALIAITEIIEALPSHMLPPFDKAFEEYKQYFQQVYEEIKNPNNGKANNSKI